MLYCYLYSYTIVIINYIPLLIRGSCPWTSLIEYREHNDHNALVSKEQFVRYKNMICDNYSQNQKDLYDYMIKVK